MKQRVMKIAVIVMAAITLAIGVLASRQVFFHVSGDFELLGVVWGLIVLLALFAAVQVLCLFLTKPQLKKIGFFLLHGGLVLMLAGSLVYYLVGIKVAGVYPVNDYASSADVQFMRMKGNLFKGDDYAANLTSFNIGATKFVTEYYDPVYDVYIDGGDTRVLTDVTGKNGVYDFGEYGKATEAEAYQNGTYQTISLGNEVYAVPRLTASYYEASVVVYNREKDTNTQETLTVNHPIRVNGWKIFLMSGSDTSVQLILKYDPGEYIMLAGIWLTVAGTLISCLWRRKGVKA